MVQYVFVALMVAAALYDITTYRIPNILVLLVGVLFIGIALLHRDDVSWGGHFGAAALCLVAGLIPYYYRQMGAGDVKLLSAAALWSGLDALPPFLLLIALSGAAFTLLVIGMRIVLSSGRIASLILGEQAGPRLLQRGEGIPYGVAICIGSIAALPWYPPWVWALN